MGINLVAFERGKRGPHHGAVGGQYLRVSVPEMHRQESALLDVGVQHRERAAG